jgi:hypothetical protein
MISNTQKTNEDENKSLVSQVKKRNNREEGIPKKSKIPHYNKDASNIICYSCQKMGHCDFQHPDRNEKGKKKHHAHAEEV